MPEHVHHVLVLAVALVVCALVFSRTPEVLSHKSWSVEITRAYRVDDERDWRIITYNHETTDGMRLHHRLRTGRLPRVVRHRPPPDQCDVWTRVRVPDVALGVSPFLTLVACFIRECSFMKTEDRITTGVLVGTRGGLDEAVRFSTRGSFVRTAHVTYDCMDDLSLTAIAEAQKRSIEHVRSSDRLHDTFVERSTALRCHYIFNKWMLDTIQRDDGRVLRLHRGGHRVSLEYILGIRMPLDLKFVHEEGNTWAILATPLWMTVCV